MNPFTIRPEEEQKNVYNITFIKFIFLIITLQKDEKKQVFSEN